MITPVMLPHAGCAAIYAALSALILVRARTSRTGWALAAAAAATAGWSASVALQPEAPLTGLPAALDLVRSVGWYLFILHLYRRTVRSRGQLTQAFAMMGFVLLLVATVTMLVEPTGAGGMSLLSAGTAARLGLAVCNILLIENLYQNVTDDAKWYINLPCIGLGALFVFDIVLSADAVLFRQASPSLVGGRAVATAIVAPLLAIAAARNRDWKIDIHVSRSAAFHSATLVVAGIFLLGLSAAGELFRHLGAGWSGVAETSLVFAGLLVTAVLLTSRSARSRLRSLVVDNFFSSRFDYRREWLRCIATLSAGDSEGTLPVRVIRAVADVVDSQGGILYLRPAEGAAAFFHWEAAWNLPSDGMPLSADCRLVAALRGGTWTVELDAATRPPEVPQATWLAVPLPLGSADPAREGEPGRAASSPILGFILLAPPRAPFRLDREVFELLRILAREVATYLAEQRATEVLTQGRQLADYGKRFAFVAHDIKNVSSQLSLLLSNAERHLANPEFQRDMLATVRASVQKISALLRRLEAPEPEPPAATLQPVERLAPLVASLARGSGVAVTLDYDRTGVGVGMPEAAFDAVVTHLVSNAADATLARHSANGAASGAPPPVRVSVSHVGNRVLVDITDQGTGMAESFIRDTLFRPFGTAKRGGTGIGAFQARELLREAGGDLVVTSRPGHGTTMRLVLPAAIGRRQLAERVEERA